ncbi:hypothetical protein [Companilactobacillus sp. HBUAS56257]|uniref:hypothetical protein n=1 Tax=Companilactobacillus sp. HBUAS56257 TaxID=3109360 RepID=UPI002FEF6844
MENSTSTMIILDWNLLMCLREYHDQEEQVKSIDILKELNREGRVYFSVEVLAYFRQFMEQADGYEFVSDFLDGDELQELDDFEGLENLDFEKRFENHNDISMLVYSTFQTLADLELDIRGGLLDEHVKLLYVDCAEQWLDEGKLEMAEAIRSRFFLEFGKCARELDFAVDAGTISAEGFAEFLGMYYWNSEDEI